MIAPAVDRSRTSGRRRFAAITGAVAVAAALWAVIGSTWILPELSANSDEGIYLLQADSLRAGQLAPTAPEVDADAYRPWFASVRQGRYVLKYAPVHPSVLAASGAITGSARPALGLIAGAQVLLVVALARELGAERRAAVLAGVLFASAPLVVQLDITHLSYGTSLCLLLGTVTAALRARRTASRRSAVLAGLLLGLATFARPYDGLLAGVVLVAGLAVMERRRPGRMAPMALARWAAVGVTAPLVGLLAFNADLTGSPLTFPFRLLEPSDGPGFGLRRSLPTDAGLDYTPGRALGSLSRNGMLVAVWCAGGVVGVFLALSAFVRRRLRGDAILLALLVVWPIGYALFWGSYAVAFQWDGALFLGPYYYLPMVAALAIASAVSLEDLWRWRPSLAATAALASLVLTVAVLVPRLVEQRQRSDPRSEVAQLLQDEVREPALVFVPPIYGSYLQNPLSFLRNTPALDGPVVYALDRGREPNERIREAHPSRTAYRLVFLNGWSDQPSFDPVVRLDRL